MKMHFFFKKSKQKQRGFGGVTYRDLVLTRGDLHAVALQTHAEWEKEEEKQEKKIESCGVLQKNAAGLVIPTGFPIIPIKKQSWLQLFLRPTLHFCSLSGTGSLISCCSSTQMGDVEAACAPTELCAAKKKALPQSVELLSHLGNRFQIFLFF